MFDQGIPDFRQKYSKADILVLTLQLFFFLVEIKKTEGKTTSFQTHVGCLSQPSHMNQWRFCWKSIRWNCSPLVPGIKMGAAVSYAGTKTATGIMCFCVLTQDYNCKSRAVWWDLGTMRYGLGLHSKWLGFTLSSSGLLWTSPLFFWPNRYCIFFL